MSSPGHNILTTDHSVLTLTYVISNAFPEIQSLPNLRSTSSYISLKLGMNLHVYYKPGMNLYLMVS